jgi:hypothetical protein
MHGQVSAARPTMHPSSFRDGEAERATQGRPSKEEQASQEKALGSTLATRSTSQQQSGKIEEAAHGSAFLASDQSRCVT